MGRRWSLICAAGVALAAGPSVAADLVKVVPYSGQLDLDGQPYTGDIQIQFRLCTHPDEDACPWTEVHPAVQVFNGSFSVRLGAPAGGDAVPIEETVSQNTQFFLEMSLRPVAPPVPEGEEPPPEAEWVRLSGRQEISPTPQAIWTASATDLTLRSLRVTGDAAVEGTLAAGTLRVAPNGRLSNTDGEALYVDDEEGLFVARGGAVVGGTVRATGNVTADGNIVAGNTITAGGTVSAPAVSVGNADSVISRHASLGISLNSPGGVYIPSGGLYANGAVEVVNSLVNPTGRPLTVTDPQGMLVNQGDLNVSAGAMAASGNVTAGADVVSGRNIHLPGNLHIGGQRITRMAISNAVSSAVGENRDTGFQNIYNGLATNSICFLNYVRFVGLDGGDDAALCHVRRNAGSWELRSATGGGGSGANCEATCLTWDD